MNTATIYTDDYLVEDAKHCKSTARALDILLTVPLGLRPAVFAEAIYTQNMIAVRYSEALRMAARTVIENNGRPVR